MLTVTTGKKQKYNYSIAFIKVFMSFCVICCHFWATGDPSLYPVSMMHRIRDVAAFPHSGDLICYVGERKNGYMEQCIVSQ